MYVLYYTATAMRTYSYAQFSFPGRCPWVPYPLSTHSLPFPTPSLPVPAYTVPMSAPGICGLVGSLADGGTLFDPL